MRILRFINLFALVASVAVISASCSSVTEEHITASAEAITFSRAVGRKAATGGFVINKDSLVMRETK